MKYRVVGWTEYENDTVEDGPLTDAADAAIIDEIREKGYCFTGENHQYRLLCTPVLNDGKKRCYGQRAFGRVMATAHGYNGKTDYALFAFSLSDGDDDEDKAVMPKERYLPGVTPIGDNYAEEFTVEVDGAMLERALAGEEISVEDLAELKYIDTGDGLTLISGERSEHFKVLLAERKMDITKEEEMFIFFKCYYESKEERERAEEMYRNAKYLIGLTLERD